MSAEPMSPPVLPPTPAKSRRPFLILGGVALAVLIVGGSYLIYSAGREDTDDAQVMADVVPVGPRVSGQVLRVPVIENQPVKKGDLLVELDAADFVARVQQAEAELETQRAQAEAADAQVAVVEANSTGGLRSARAVVSGSSEGVSAAAAQEAAAQAALVRAQAEVRRTELDLQRNKRMRESGAVAQAVLDNAQIAYDSALASLEQARAQVTAAVDARHQAISRVAEARGRLNQSLPIESQITTARANAALAHARIKSAEAALELAKLQLSYTKIVAPADGMASRLTARAGQLVQTGQTLVELVPLQTYVIANFKETQIGRMRPGQPVEVAVDTYPGRVFHGKVESLSGGTGAVFSLLPPDNASGNFVKVVQRVPVRVAWSDLPQDVVLRAGLSADVTVHVR